MPNAGWKKRPVKNWSKVTRKFRYASSGLLSLIKNCNNRLLIDIINRITEIVSGYWMSNFCKYFLTYDASMCCVLRYRQSNPSDPWLTLCKGKNRIKSQTTLVLKRRIGVCFSYVEASRGSDTLRNGMKSHVFQAFDQLDLHKFRKDFTAPMQDHDKKFR